MLILALASGLRDADAGRVLFDFEQPADRDRFGQGIGNGTMQVETNRGVTSGTAAIGLTVTKGEGWGAVEFPADALRGWGDHAALAVDIDADQPGMLALEFWDDASRNYATRCTLERPVRIGPQTLTWRFDALRRNCREGFGPEEWLAEDRIQLQRLRRALFIITRNVAADTRMMLDNIRLLDVGDMVAPLRCKLPGGWTGFDFGAVSARAAVEGMVAVNAWTIFTNGAGYGFVFPGHQADGGSSWPDSLAGTFIASKGPHESVFNARLSNGTYSAWILGGRIIRSDLEERRFLLRLNDRMVIDESPSAIKFCGTNYLYRFLDTRYSPAPHALWFNYIDRMYPVLTGSVQVTNGMLTLAMRNCFLGAMVVAPSAVSNGASRFIGDLQTLRIEQFEKELPHLDPLPQTATGTPFEVYAPDAGRTIMPWSRPTELERARRELAGAGAPGQNLFFRLVLIPNREWCVGRLTLADFQGASSLLPADSIRGFTQAYRFNGGAVSEMALRPGLSFTAERGVAQCFWFWMRIPHAALPGRYTGEFTLQVDGAEPVPVPVVIEVYPFKLPDIIPASIGMYYSEPSAPALPAPLRESRLREQVAWMRSVGFTSIPVGAPRLKEVDVKGGKVVMEWDGFGFDLARQNGMGRHPEQRLMANQLNLARAIGKRLGPTGRELDRNPGLELRQANFLPLYRDCLRQYKQLIDRFGMPVAVEVVDEPREMPNPWNRNLADSLRYAGWLREAGIPTFITMMGDRQSGRDYTPLAAAIDIVSTHGGDASSEIMRMATSPGKTLWLYNMGMNRLTWGFFPWRVGARGRWEWHFCWPEDRATGGYPGREWYNPFTGMHGLAPSAPCEGYPGAMLFQSAFIAVAEGITDYTYLVALDTAVAKALSQADSPRLDAATAASKLLAEIRNALPEHFPGSVSAPGGIQSDWPLDAWRSRIAEFLNVIGEM